ncbi:MAG: extracellular solute-binding protein [Chloroflexi bacterium]|nr:extracellular solute-binding protein [Chloroflexota bacterium]
MVSTKRFSVLLLVMLVIGVLSLPAQAQDATEMAGGATIPAAKCAAPGDVTIRVWDENWAKVLKDATAAWVSDYCPGANVTIDQVPWSNYWDKLKIDAASGDLPDVFNLNQATGYNYAAQGSLLDLTPYFAKSGIDATVWGPGLVDPYRYGDNNDIYAAPLEWVTAVVFYNKDLFDKAGLAYPTADWTWDDYAKDAAALTDSANGVYGSASFAEYVAGWGSWIASAGVPPQVTQDHTTCTLTEPGSIEALNFLKGLQDSGYSPSISQMGGSGADDEYNLFKSGKVGLYLGGNWKLPNAKDDLAFNWDLVTMPHNPTTGLSRPVLHASSWAASSSSKNPDLAANMVQYLISDEGQKFFADAGGVAPSDPNPELQQAWVDSFGIAGKNIQAFVDATKDSQGYTQFSGESIDKATSDMITNIFDLGMSVEDATKAACDGMQPDLVKAS